MGYLNIASDLFLGAAELNRLIQFLDDHGWRKMFVENIATPGISFKGVEPYVDNLTLNSETAVKNFSSFYVSKSSMTPQRYLKISAGTAVDKYGNLITNTKEIDGFDPSSHDGSRVTYDSTSTEWAGTYLIKVKYRLSFDEVLRVNIDTADGSISGLELHKILRSMPNAPSVVTFPYSEKNQSEYEVIWVSPNGLSAQLSGSFLTEPNVAMRVRGTFTFGVSPSEASKYPFRYDSCEFVSVKADANGNFPPDDADDGTIEFPLAKVVVSAGVGGGATSTQVFDMRSKYVYQTKQDFDTLAWNFIEGDGIVGIESVQYTPYGTARDQNIVQIGWGIRTDNWTFDSNTNTLTINNIVGGGRIKSVNDLTTDIVSRFIGWRLYLQDGAYTVVTGASYTGGNSFNVTFGSTKIGDIPSAGGGVQLVLVPPVETVSFLITPVSVIKNVNETLGGREITVSSPVFKGYLRVPLYVHPTINPTTNYTLLYSYAKGASFLKWRPIKDGSFYDANQFLDDGTTLISGAVTSPYTGDLPIRLKESDLSFNKRFGIVSNGDNLGVKVMPWRTGTRDVTNGVSSPIRLVPGKDEHEIIIVNDVLDGRDRASYVLNENIYINFQEPSRDATTWTFEFKGKFRLYNATNAFGIYFTTGYVNTISTGTTIFSIVPEMEEYQDDTVTPAVTRTRVARPYKNAYLKQPVAEGGGDVPSHFRIRFIYDANAPDGYSKWSYFILSPYLDRQQFIAQIDSTRATQLAALEARMVPKAGGAMTGPLLLSGDAVPGDPVNRAVTWEQVRDAYQMSESRADGIALNTFFSPGIYAIYNAVQGPPQIPQYSPGMLEVKKGYANHTRSDVDLVVTQTLYYFFPNSGTPLQTPTAPVDNALIRTRIFERTILLYNDAAFHVNQWTETTNTDSLQSKGYIYNNDLNLVLKQGTYNLDPSNSAVLNGPAGLFPGLDIARSMLLVNVAYITGSADVPDDSVITQTLWCPTRVSSGDASTGVTRMFTRSIHWQTSGGSFRLHAAQWNEVVLWDKFKNAFINKTGWFNLDLNTIKSPGAIQLGNFTNGPLEIDGSNIPNKLSNLSVTIGYGEDGSKLIKQVLSQPSDPADTPADKSYSRIWVRTMMVDTPATNANLANNQFHQNQWVEMMTSKSFVKDALIMREKQPENQDLATFTKAGTFHLTDIIGGPDGIERFTPCMLKVEKAYFDDTHSNTNLMITQKLNFFFPNMGVPAPNVPAQWVPNSAVRTRIFERTIMIYNGAQFHQKQWTEVTNFNALETKRGLPESNGGFLAPITVNGTTNLPVNDLNWVLAQGIYTFDPTSNNPNRPIEQPFPNSEVLSPNEYGWATLVVNVGYYGGGNYTNPNETTITQTLYYPKNFGLGDASKVRTRMFVRSIPFVNNTSTYQFNRSQWVEMADASKCLMDRGTYGGDLNDLIRMGYYVLLGTVTNLPITPAFQGGGLFEVVRTGDIVKQIFTYGDSVRYRLGYISNNVALWNIWTALRTEAD